MNSSVQEHRSISLLLHRYISSSLQGSVYYIGREQYLKPALVKGHFQNSYRRNARSLNPGAQSTGQGLKGHWEQLQHTLYRNDNGSVMRWAGLGGFDSLGFVYYYYYYYYYYFGVVLFHFDFHWFNSYFYKVFSFLANTPHFCFKKVLDKHSCMKETVLKPVGSSRQSISRTVNKWFILRASVLLSWAGKSQDVWPTEYILKGQQPHKSTRW